MTTQEFVKLEKRLLPNFPGFAIRGAMLFIRPIEHVLRGFYFEPSGFNRKRFYINLFFMPLWVPAKRVYFTFGHRVKHVWDIDEANLEATLKLEMCKDALFLRRLRTPKDVANALKPLTKGNTATGYVNPHCYEALAYTLIKAGETAAAANVIDNLMRRRNPEVAWESEIASRAELIKKKLLEDPEKAKRQLVAWEAETIRDLRLEDLLSERP